MDFISFTVWGSPVPEQKKIVRPKGLDYPIVKRLKAVEQWIQDVKVQALAYKPAQMFMDGVILYMAGALPRPKSHPKTKEKPHLTKPDWDNLAKTSSEALAGIFYPNDSYVVKGTFEKRYCKIGEAPHVRFTITDLSSIGKDTENA